MFGLFRQFVSLRRLQFFDEMVVAVLRQILLYTSRLPHYSLPTFPSLYSRYSNMEDAMKGSLTLLSLVLAGAVVVGIPASANPAATENKAAHATKKETKWQGHVERIYKDLSQMDIRGGAAGESEDLRKVAYDSSTQWTKLGKPGQQDDVKEGSFVIVLGQLDEKGTLHATRIDLRVPR
jgi:hypothetical protein